MVKLNNYYDKNLILKIFSIILLRVLIDECKKNYIKMVTIRNPTMENEGKDESL